MKNKDMPAMPQPMIDHEGEVYTTFDSSYGKQSGLTKREMFAMHAMAAWIQHHGTSRGYGFSAEEAATDAVSCADALLAELDK